MAGSLEWFWIVRGYLAEGHRRLEDALASAPPGTPHRDRALAAAGQIAVQMGDAAHARPLLLEALSLARQSGNARLVVLTLSHLGWAAEALGEPGNAVVNHQHAVAAARAAEDDWALSIALNNYAIMGARVGDFEQARMPLEVSLLLARRIGEPRAIALAAYNLGEATLSLGDFDTAETLMNEALAQAREIDFRGIIASALCARAVISLERSDLESAGAQLYAAIEPTRSTNDTEAAASLLAIAGTVAAIHHEPLRAAKLWGAAAHARARIGLPGTPAIDKLQAQWESNARAAAPNTASWDAAWSAGADMPVDEALVLAAGERNRNQMP